MIDEISKDLAETFKVSEEDKEKILPGFEPETVAKEIA